MKLIWTYPVVCVPGATSWELLLEEVACSLKLITTLFIIQYYITAELGVALLNKIRRDVTDIEKQWNPATVELHLSGRWLSGSAWPFG